MVCPSCGEKNRDEARFCTYCGTTLALRCPTCDTEVIPGGRFCDACGAAVDPGVAGVDSPVAARKVVTVLFADLSGSTAEEERMDPESVRSALDRFYAAMRTSVERHGGRVVKFTGDGCMAVFGVPEVHEDDAARALDAALTMRAELEPLAADLAFQVSLKIGINTGEVVVSPVDEDVVGDVVNVAARLEGAARGGEILVGESTWRATRSAARFEAVAPLALKGKSEPVPAYRLLSIDERTAESATAPFVGRDDELGRLVGAFAAATESSAARLVTIIGSPGLGKTRLTRELMARLAADAQLRETRCEPAGGSTLAPVADLLRAVAGVTETDAPDVVVTALAGRVPADDPDRERVASRAAAVLGVGAPGSTEETFWAVRRLLESAARERPVVLIVDDVHWAEPLLLDLIEHLAEWIREAPVLLVCTARPEIRERRPSLAEGGRSGDVIALEGLDPSCTRRLALDLLGTDELPSELLARIPASTEGNPLFVRELVRMLVDDGVLQRTGNGWSATIDVDAIQVPPTISSLLAARVDRLRADERTVLETAAVVGKEFYRGAVSALVPPAMRDLVDGCLESLRRKELVEPAGTYWIDEPVYRFHHALIRDAAYRRVLKEARAELHERAAEWLSGKTSGVPGGHEELIGYHLEQACVCRRQLGRPDDELGRRAASLLGAAARRALDRDDLPAAAALSGRALEVLPEDDAERTELLVVRCEALLSMGDVASGTRSVAELARLADTPRLRAWTTCFEGHAANLTSLPGADRLETLVAAAAELAALGDDAGAAKAHTVHAQALAKRGRYGECEEALDRALTFARAADDRRRITATLGLAPHAQLWGPNVVSRAGGRCLDVIRLLRITTGSPAVEATSLRCQAVLEAFRGRFDAARRMLRSARRTLTELGLRHELLETDQFTGVAELVAGDAASALEPLRRAYDGFRESGVDVPAAQTAALLARAHLEAGDEAVAAEMLDECDRLGVDDHRAVIGSCSVRAELLARRGEPDRARRFAEEAVELAATTDALVDHGMACRSLAVVLRAGGDAAGAERALARALALFERKGATALLEREASPAENGQPVASEPVGEQPSNRCTEVSARFRDRLAAGDFDGAAAYFDDHIDFEDRRRGLRAELDPQESFSNLRLIADFGVSFSDETIAVRGDRLALMRQAWRIEGGYTAEVLLLAEVGDGDRFVRVAQFDASDLEAALVELERWHGDGSGEESSAQTTAERAWRRFHTVWSARDWAAMSELMSPDMVIDDRRPGIQNVVEGRDAVIADQRAIAALGAVEMSYRVVQRWGEHALVINAVFHDAGGRSVSAVHVLMLQRYTPDGLLARMIVFDADAIDAALAELTSSVAAEETLATRSARRFVRAFNDGDWDHVASYFAPDYVYRDVRPGLGATLVGAETAAENMRQSSGRGAAELTYEPIAVRGDRHVLARWSWRAADWDVEFVAADRYDEHGRSSRAVVFTHEQMHEALLELDRLYLEDEGAGLDALRILVDSIEAHTRRDWDAMLASVAPDVRVVDRRPASLGEATGMDGFSSPIVALTEVVPDARIHLMEVIAADPHRVLVRVVVRGTNVEGGEVDLPLLFVNRIEAGVVRDVGYFSVDQLDQAREMYQELRRGGGTPALGRDVVPPNRAAAVQRALMEAAITGDREVVLRNDAPGVVIDDRRRGLGTELVGVDAALAFVAATAAIGIVSHDSRVLATRGEELSILRSVFSGEFEVELVTLSRVDEHGLLLRATMFEPADLDEAVNELDRLYLAGVGATFERPVRAATQIVRAVGARDWDVVRDLFTPDAAILDHRRVSLGEMGPQEWVHTLASLVDLLPFRTFVAAFHAVAPQACLFEVLNHGSTADGVDAEIQFLCVIGLRGDLVASWEYFPVEDASSARARYDELADAAPAPPRNASTRAQDRLADAYNSGDLEASRALRAETFVLEDRRRGMRNVVVGPDAAIENLRAARELGMHSVTHDVLAVRGERLALLRQVFHGNDAEVPWLAVAEIDDAGLISRAVCFDDEDFNAAVDLLDRWFIEGEGAPHAHLLGLLGQIRDAIAAQDWSSYRSMLDEEVVLVDHRPLSLGQIRGREGVVATLDTWAEMVQDQRPIVRTLYAIANDRLLSESVISATAAHGGTIELGLLRIQQWKGDRLARVEIFPQSQLEAARRCFEELGPHTAATRVLDAVDALMRDGAWDRVDELVAEDVLVEDRRLFGSTGRGRAVFVRSLSVLRELGFRPSVATTLATVGDHLALRGGTTVDGEGNEIAALFVCEVVDGRCAALITFDPDDRAAADAELARRAGT